MCGIMGYVGTQDAWEIVMGGLRQLEYRGSQPSSFLAFLFEQPRQLVIWATTNSPASSRPSQTGR